MNNKEKKISLFVKNDNSWIKSIQKNPTLLSHNEK